MLFLCLWGICLSATAQKYMFKHLEVKDGLSNNQVNAIYKDSRGFMWFGTASGLNRYDGYEFKVYRNQNNDAKSLPDNYIENIQEDVSGNLWIRTSAGYVFYNSLTDTFDRDVEKWMWNIGISGNPSSIYIDKHKIFWVYVLGKGIYRYVNGEKKAERVNVKAEALLNADIVDMIESNEGILLIYNHGVLVCLDKEKLNVKWTINDISSDIGKETVNDFSLFIDQKEQLWIYGVLGMWIYNLPQKTWELRSPKDDSYNSVRAVAQDKRGRMWLGKDQDGVELVDAQGNHIHLINVPNNERTLSNNTITALYEDAAGTMWVGTYKKGISYYNESIFKFGIVDIGDINCVENGRKDVVWLGTSGSGLICWNRSTDERKVFSHTSDPHSISSDIIVSLLLDSNDKLWAGTYWGGLNCYDGNRFIHYRAGGENSLASDNVWALVEDADKNIWIGTLGGGLQCLNPATGVFVTYSSNNSNLVSDHVSSLCLGRNNTLIIGTSVGVAIMDLATRKITNFAGNRSGVRQFTNQTVNQVYEDSRGLIWVGTREGLNVYDPKQDELYEVAVKPNFSEFYILGITEDENKSMWVSAGGELINVTLSVEGKTGKLSFRCHTYDERDGLQSCDFNQRSLKRLHSGEIVVGGLYGLNNFRSDNIKYNRALPKVMFTGFQLFNEEVKVGEEYDGQIILKEALNKTEEVVLGYKQNVFTVLFASDNYVLPEKTRYHYKLDGFNEDWLISMADQHRVTYTNLAPGSYLLKVKATNSDGYAGTEEATLKIVILPPFWMTPWAYACYIFLLIGGLFLAFYAVQRRERNKFKIRQMEQDAQRAEEVNQMKFRFFTNVSHELRTPLTLIISPLEGMIKETKEAKQLDKLNLMHRNALRLLNLVNQLLDFRKNEMAGLHLSLSEGDIVAYVRNICSSFLILSEKKNVHLTFFTAVESLNMAFDEDKVGKIVMNLLSNAFKFTPDGGRVDVSLEILKGSPETLEIKVSDTGSGVKDEDKERIFERFYQGSKKEGSTGLGLAIADSICRLQHLNIRYYFEQEEHCFEISK